MRVFAHKLVSGLCQVPAVTHLEELTLKGGQGTALPIYDKSG